MREETSSATWARRARVAARVLLAPVLLLCVVWASAALWFDGPGGRVFAAILAAGFPLACLGLLLWVRPLRRGALAVVVAFVVVLVWWRLIPPRNDRNWQRDVARTASVELQGSRITVHNVRNFDYRTETDYTERWETRTYDLEKLQGLDIFVCYWGPTLIAHTIMSWEFSDGTHLASSIETRKEVGEEYSAVKGFFRQFEVYYVVADERDVVRLRTNYRVPGEHVFLYRLRAKPAAARALLMSYVEEINRLAAKPRWYNALTENCTTTIRHHAQEIGAAQPWDWRILANGHGDQMFYDRKMINTSLPFEEVRRQSEITEKAKAADRAPDFSRRIRAGLPDRP